MPKFHVDKSITINKPINEVYNTLNDYSKWTPWSPWLITEPDARVTVAPDNKSYEWQGKVTGEGNMKIYNEVENKKIEIDLTFLKPWKSTAKTWFDLSEDGQGTKVHWKMDSSLPFFMFWMKNMMTEMIGMDYNRGLGMLKEYVEDGKIDSNLDIKGMGTREGCDYVGIKTSTTIDKIGETMKRDYSKLLQHVKGGHSDKVSGNPFSIYHKWDPVSKKVEYTAAIPVNGKLEMLPGMIEGSYPTTKVHTIHHKGKMEHVGNAWSAQMGRVQAKIFKQNKKIHPVEEYLNSPMDTPENELEANIHFAVK